MLYGSLRRLLHLRDQQATYLLQKPRCVKAGIEHVRDVVCGNGKAKV